ncbi:DUF317 domain-containing protein [Streptomyces buecherae]|uniref:DUF317 domain-containing protein n=1 Tax=Streptomyces buecherae TaxID=2763006 RepID=UPI00368FA3AA
MSNANVLFTAHPTHATAVIATVSEDLHLAAEAVLAVHGFEPVTERTWLLARIDHHEPYWANLATQSMADKGIALQIAPELREVINTHTSQGKHPASAAEYDALARAVEAQQIRNDLRHGRLTIHAHAYDGPSTVAVGTYHDGRSVHLHGEDHLRAVTDVFPSPIQAVSAFQRLHRDPVRPGPAPLTHTERQVIEALTALRNGQEPEGPSRREIVPAHAADPADHEAVLDQFLNQHTNWHKHRVWSDETTLAIHETQTLRLELLHEPEPGDATWTIAAYGSPVSERAWRITLTAATPAPVLETLLDELAEADPWDIALGSPVTDKTVTHATRPLSDAGWRPTINGPTITWEAPHTGGQESTVGVRFDAFSAHPSHSYLDTWTLWAGKNPEQPTWALHASAYTPTALLARLTETLAHDTGTHTTPTNQHTARPEHRTSRSPIPPATAGPPTSRRSR